MSTHTLLNAPSRIALAVAASVSGIGGFLFGFDNIVISGAIYYIRQRFALSATGLGWAVGCALIGCIIGAALAGSFADFFGRKKALIACAICFGTSSLGIWFTQTLLQFSIARVIGGLGIGAASIIAPMYIAEIAPARHRGRLVTLYQLGIVLGILGAVLSNMRIQSMGDAQWNLAVGWRLMFLVGIVPAIAFAGLIIPALESPRWLMKAGRPQEAERVLCQLEGEAAVALESAAIQHSLRIEGGRFAELLTTFRQPLFIGVMLAALQQISGITPLFSYLPEIFRQAGAGTQNAFRQSVLVGLVNLIFTLTALWLVDGVGRKTLIMGGTSVQVLAFLSVGWLYHAHANPYIVLLFVIAFVAGHACGNGAVMWVVISEIYPTKVRGRAMSIATSALWLVGYSENQVFPLMLQDLGSAATFWCFAFGAFLTLLFVGYFVPETKGKSLEDITEFWRRKAE